MTDRLNNLRAQLQQARQDITNATSVRQYDQARARVAFLSDLIQRIEVQRGPIRLEAEA